jgi:rhodanese-related sulfurtransferase
MRAGWQHFRAVAAAGFLMLAAVAASAQPARVMVALDPADPNTELLMLAVSDAPVARLAKQPVIVIPMRDLKDALRATRTNEYMVIVAPPHVAASALAHGYDLLAATEGSGREVLVGGSAVKSVADLRGKRGYFPNQDSIRTYVGRGLLANSGLTLRALKDVTYGSSSGAGLISVAAGRADATVATEQEWKDWQAANPKGGLAALATSDELPTELAVVARKEASPELRKAVVQWLAASDNAVPGSGRVRATNDEQPYQAVAKLGLFTPEQVQGVKRVTAKEAYELAQKGATLVDVRTEREFKERTARGAVWLPYTEKSLKEIDYDLKADSFIGLDKLTKNEPVVFYCNGPECWKSMKASRAAHEAGIQNVYWLRGGMPEWVKSGLPTSP